ncbi:hypothetical protein [Embleya sp. NPDC059259]|uniref:hypothetical protein n=1 Tax=unclassified Embleya TaxID=2699296 RepID=UPI0036C89251
MTDIEDTFELRDRVGAPYAGFCAVGGAVTAVVLLMPGFPAEVAVASWVVLGLVLLGLTVRCVRRESVLYLDTEGATVGRGVHRRHLPWDDVRRVVVSGFGTRTVQFHSPLDDQLHTPSQSAWSVRVHGERKPPPRTRVGVAWIGRRRDTHDLAAALERLAPQVPFTDQAGWR